MAARAGEPEEVGRFHWFVGAGVIYQRRSTSALTPLCILGWLGRNTRGHSSHPAASSSIHAAHIFAGQVRRLLLLMDQHQQ